MIIKPRKCRAKSGASACQDPQCPEKRDYLTLVRGTHNGDPNIGYDEYEARCALIKKMETNNTSLYDLRSFASKTEEYANDILNARYSKNHDQQLSLAKSQERPIINALTGNSSASTESLDMAVQMSSYEVLGETESTAGISTPKRLMKNLDRAETKLAVARHANASPEVLDRIAHDSEWATRVEYNNQDFPIEEEMTYVEASRGLLLANRRAVAANPNTRVETLQYLASLDDSDYSDYGVTDTDYRAEFVSAYEARLRS